MPENFYTILTDIGKSKITQKSILGSMLKLTKLKVGDGNGSSYNPTESQTELKNKVWDGNISSISLDEKNPNWIVIEGFIPNTDGGFTIREVGIFDDEDDLIAIGKYPETYKPVFNEGSTKDLLIRMILEVSNSNCVSLEIDPNIVLATKKDVQVLDNKIKNIKVPVTSINKKTGDIELTAEDIKCNDGKTVESSLDDKASKKDVTELRKDLNNIDLSANKVKLNNVNFKSNNVNDGMNELFQSVSSGKAKVASATTDMGVPTVATDTYDIMAGNIRKINTLPKLTKAFDDIDSQSSGYKTKKIDGITKDYIYRSNVIGSRYETPYAEFEKTDFNGTLLCSGQFVLGGKLGFINYMGDKHYNYETIVGSITMKNTYRINEYDNNNTKLRSAIIPLYNDESGYAADPCYCYKDKIFMTSFSRGLSSYYFFDFSGTKLSSSCSQNPSFEGTFFTAAIPTGRVVTYTNSNSSYYNAYSFDFENNRASLNQAIMKDGNARNIFSYMLLIPFLC